MGLGSSRMSTAEPVMAAAPVRRDVVFHSLVFILGFTLVFVAAGASASALGQAFAEYRTVITRVFGIIVILLGLNMVGLFKLPFLAMDKRIHFERRGVSYVGSLLAGLGFAAGWSPCIGPVLAAVLALASDTGSVSAGTGLLLVYSVGLGIPFLLTAVLLQSVLPLLRRMRRYLPAIEIAAGVIVIGMGLVLVTNSFLRFTGWLYQTFPALANVGTGPESASLSIGAVFLAGLVSFLSPCVLPLVPVYISLLTGQSLEKLTA
jgi:cytochrome c-type biogenesis protein